MVAEQHGLEAKLLGTRPETTPQNWTDEERPTSGTLEKNATITLPLTPSRACHHHTTPDAITC